MAALNDTWRSLRRRLKAALPYVRRREHRLLQQRHAELIEAVDSQASPAADAAVRSLKPLAVPLAGEVCLFVSHADRPALKPHVHHHIAALLDAGIQVLLVVNTDAAPEPFAIDDSLLARLNGAWVRRNLGFDFGAWAHLLQACAGREGWARLYLVNDSIIGPLDAAAFARLLQRVRASRADLVGLTEGLAPRPHLQSYFLVLQARALRSAALRALFARIRNWPSKSQVIDLYETRLTAIAQADGLSCETLFPNLSRDSRSADDTSLRWAALVDAGFPYVKTRVIAQRPNDPRVLAWLAQAGLSSPAD